MGMKKLPRRIYVKRETDPNDRRSESYLLASETTEGIEHGETVGIYELKEQKIMRVTRDLK